MFSLVFSRVKGVNVEILHYNKLIVFFMRLLIILRIAPIHEWEKGDCFFYIYHFLLTN